MSRALPLSAALAALTAGAQDLPRAITDALPRALTDGAADGTLAARGLSYLWEQACAAAQSAAGEAARGAAGLVLLALLCGLLSPVEEERRYVPLFGVLAASALAAGDLGTLLGLGAQTVEEVSALGTLLLMPLASAMALGGAVSSASLWQTAALFASDLLRRLILELLLPLIGCLAGLAAAEAILADARLRALRRGIQRGCEWCLWALLSVYAAFLTLSGVLGGTADRAVLRASRAALTGGVPVVGSALADVAESVLGAADTLRGTLGTLGVLALLSASLAPLLRFAAQVLLYRLAAFFAGILGTEELRRLLGALADAFRLMLAAVAACTLLFTVSLLLSVLMIGG